jgi:hypothetical protein
MLCGWLMVSAFVSLAKVIVIIDVMQVERKDVARNVLTATFLRHHTIRHDTINKNPNK